jgi:fucose 4-O-acetylase-like acetyltransferase
MAMSGKQRLDWVDSAKGIGIVLVVYGHVARGLEHGGIFAHSRLYRLVDASIYSFHMPLFFFLSGLFFLSSFRKQGIGLLRSKVGSIVYPYLFWSVLQLGFKMVMSGYTNSQAGWGDMLTILWRPVEQFWFLYALLLIFIVTSLVFSLLRRMRMTEPGQVAVTAVFSLLLFFFSYLLPGVFQVQTVAHYMVYFVLGICFASYRHAPSSKRAIVALPVCFLLACYSVFYEGEWSADSSSMQLALAIAGISTIVTIIPFFARRFAGFVAWLGRYSMEIYCAHVITASGVRIVLYHFLAIDHVIPHLVVGLLAGLFLPILLAHILRRVILVRFLSQASIAERPSL